MELLNNIPVSLELEKVLKGLRLRNVSKYVQGTVRELIGIVQPLAKPKAIYEVSYVDNRTEDSVCIDGVKFTSHILSINLDKVERVFPYVATCGKELDEIALPSDDFMKSYYLDAIKDAVLGSARSYLKDYLIRNYALGQISHMSPGSLTDWPITQQEELFSIFGNLEDLIGVKLTENFLMVPLKSVSGIYFPTEIEFVSCQLCPRELCSGRKAPYDPDLAQKYRKKV